VFRFLTKTHIKTAEGVLEEFGRKLTELLFDEKHREMVFYLSRKNGFDEKELSLELCCAYLFCLKMIAEADCLYLNKKIIPAVEESLSKSLVQANIKEYEIKENSDFYDCFKTKYKRLISLYESVVKERYKLLKGLSRDIINSITGNDNLNLKSVKINKVFLMDILEEKMIGIQELLNDYPGL